jgi:ABC-type transport system substrate-binding protein
MVLEYLDSSESGVKIVSSWMRNLEKLGITLKVRNVDYALYQQRMDKYDFDIVTLNVPGTHNPGQEYAELFGSAAADVEGARTMSVSRARPWMPSSPRWLRPSPSSRCCPPAMRWSASSCTAIT